jgi:hypothetical protein
MSLKTLFVVPVSAENKEWVKEIKRNVNTTHYQLIQDWKCQYDNQEYKRIVLQRGEREDDDGPNFMGFNTTEKAVVQLIKDAMYDIGSEYELDKVPLDLVEEFYKNNIDGGVIYLRSGPIKDPKELMKYKQIRTSILENDAYKDVRMMDAIESEIERRGGKLIVSGTKFLLSFRLIRIALNNNIIKDSELKMKTIKFYSCYERYIETKAKKDLDHIDGIKAEIKSLSEDVRKQKIYDGQIERDGNGLLFDEFIYWMYLLKPGDQFETPSRNDKGENKRFEIVSVDQYPTKCDIFDEDIIHCARINIKYINVDDDVETVSYYFPQRVTGNNNHLQFIMD